MRCLVLLTALCLLVSGTATCRTWHVNQDGSGDATTIQGGMDLASAGDTVLVHPGEYAERISMESYVSLVSAGGPAVTILNCSPEYPFYIIYGPCRGGLIRGFTFRGSPGVTATGIYFGCSPGEPSTYVIGNVFSDFIWYEGGGVVLYNGGGAVIQDNLFQDCIGWDAGGGVAVLYGSWARIEGNTFTGCYSKVGGAVSCSQG